MTDYASPPKKVDLCSKNGTVFGNRVVGGVGGAAWGVGELTSNFKYSG